MEEEGDWATAQNIFPIEVISGSSLFLGPGPYLHWLKQSKERYKIFESAGS